MEHEERSEELEQEADKLEQESEKLEERIGETKQDWESKKSDESVPGAQEGDEAG